MILAMLACGTPDYRAADLQLDVATPLPAAAETLRLCVDGWGVYEAGAGNGRVAVAGLVPDAEYAVTVDVRDADDALIGAAGPIVLGPGQTWATAPLGDTPGAGCDATGAPVADGEASWLLAVRFDEEDTPWDQL